MKKYQEITKIIIVYALVGCIWIYLSDTVLFWLLKDREMIAELSIYKGIVFIALTSLLLFFSSPVSLSGSGDRMNACMQAKNASGWPWKPPATASGTGT